MIPTAIMAVISVGCVVVFLFVLGSGRKMIGRWFEKRNAIRESRMRGEACVRCGYPVRGLSLPRCPECGAMKGFDATLAELGISEDELRVNKNKPE
ncbi:MAG TPA: hypothetical protein VNT79_15885 [Phycisphaerae bacterium]|nr:hypothetical protein [Phycisphaerae bacterium]